ncbi:hypothetical protein MHYP_G00219450 [Metynnis hypsauchen]
MKIQHSELQDNSILRPALVAHGNYKFLCELHLCMWPMYINCVYAHIYAPKKQWRGGRWGPPLFRIIIIVSSQSRIPLSGNVQKVESETDAEVAPLSVDQAQWTRSDSACGSASGWRTASLLEVKGLIQADWAVQSSAFRAESALTLLPPHNTQLCPEEKARQGSLFYPERLSRVQAVVLRFVQPQHLGVYVMHAPLFSFSRAHCNKIMNMVNTTGRAAGPTAQRGHRAGLESLRGLSAALDVAVKSASLDGTLRDRPSGT